MAKKVKEILTLGKGAPQALQSGRKGERVEAFFQMLEEHFPVRIALRGRNVQVKGQKESVEQVKGVIAEFLTSLEQAHAEPSQFLRRFAHNPKPGLLVSPTLFVTTRGREVGPVNDAQREYLAALQEHDIVFAEGPAGTGKTHLAVAYGCSLLREKKIARLILTRPAVEAGEHLGYLPGDVMAKIEPYFRPVYDALFEMLEAELYARLMERGIIEVAPLAYMRGRTLNEAFVIMDEAQNTSPEQMKMFLTRLGRDSSAVITGDSTQIDLSGAKSSGMVEAMAVLRDVPGIKTVRFHREDVIRHPLVQRIVEAYEREGKKKRVRQSGAIR